MAGWPTGAFIPMRMDTFCQILSVATCPKLASLFLFPVENNFAIENVSLSVMSVIIKFHESLAVRDAFTSNFDIHILAFAHLNRQGAPLLRKYKGKIQC